jgi:heat shock protein HslJ
MPVVDPLSREIICFNFHNVRTSGNEGIILELFLKNVFMKINNMKTVLYAITAILLCVMPASLRAQTKMTIWIKENKVSCNGIGQSDCFQVKYNSKDTTWQVLYGAIDGFKYEEGYRYSLTVKKYKVANPPADAPACKYKLVKVISKRKIASGSEEYWSYIYKNNWKLIQLNGVTITSGKVSILFMANNRFSGTSGCNRMTGSFATEGNKISFGPVASTKMMCTDENTMKLENEFLAAINDGEYTFDVADQALNFYKEGKIIMMFGVDNSNRKK